MNVIFYTANIFVLDAVSGIVAFTVDVVTFVSNTITNSDVADICWLLILLLIFSLLLLLIIVADSVVNPFDTNFVPVGVNIVSNDFL